jgi:hypothetical protein
MVSSWLSLLFPPLSSKLIWIFWLSLLLGVGAGQLKTVLDNEVEAVRRMVTGKQAE